MMLDEICHREKLHIFMQLYYLVVCQKKIIYASLHIFAGKSIFLSDYFFMDYLIYNADSRMQMGLIYLFISERCLFS